MRLGETAGTPVEKHVSVRGADLAYCEWGCRSSRRPTILLVHATGFHGRCWDAVIRHLGADRHASCRWHAIALDLRGHGRSTKQGPYDWREFGADIAAFVEILELDGVLGVGHSMGGHAVVQAAGRHPDRFSRLLLVDPVVLAPEAYAGHSDWPAPTSPEQHPVSRRRNRWRSVEAMFERFASRHPFSLWDRDVLMDYCRHGLVAEGDGFVLRCPPLVEASVYLGSAERDVGAVVARLPHPVVVLRGDAKRRRPRGPHGLRRLAHLGGPGGGVSERPRRLPAAADALHSHAAAGSRRRPHPRSRRGLGACVAGRRETGRIAWRHGRQVFAMRCRTLGRGSAAARPPRKA